MSVWFQPPGEVLGDPNDEYASEAGILPEGSLLNIVKVDLVPDPKYKTSAWLVIYNDGQVPIRFRMKESTARPLHAILRNLVMRNNERDYQRARRGPSEAEWRRQYVGDFTS